MNIGRMGKNRLVAGFVAAIAGGGCGTTHVAQVAKPQIVHVAPAQPAQTVSKLAETVADSLDLNELKYPQGIVFNASPETPAKKVTRRLLQALAAPFKKDYTLENATDYDVFYLSRFDGKGITNLRKCDNKEPSTISAWDFQKALGAKSIDSSAFDKTMSSEEFHRMVGAYNFTFPDTGCVVHAVSGDNTLTYLSKPENTQDLKTLQEYLGMDK